MNSNGFIAVGWATRAVTPVFDGLWAQALMFHTAKSRVRFAHHQHQRESRGLWWVTAHERQSFVLKAVPAPLPTLQL
jgi:hypothetical protein